MRAPPPLSWPTPVQPALRRSLRAVVLLVSLVQFAWLAPHWLDVDAAEWPHLLLLTLGVTAACLWLGRALPRLAEPPGERLRWTGRDWRWDRHTPSMDGPSGHMELLLDTEAWLLVRWRASAPPSAGPRTHWRLLGRCEAPAAWSRLRRALVTPPPAAAPDEH